MKCLERGDTPQRTGTTPNEMQEETGQEEPHRAQSLCVAQSPLPNLTLGKVRIKWPQACKTTAWEQFDEDVDVEVLEASVKGEGPTP